MDRRRFLQAAAVSPLLASGSLRAGDDEHQTPIIDTHLHCFAGSDDPRFPYHPDGPYQPEEPATPEHLLRLMDEAGVDYAVVVHPEPYQDDHRYLEHCLDVGEGKLKGTCLFFADTPGSLELRELWKHVGDLGLAVQLHFEPRYAPGFEPLIEAFPATTVIIDHLGRPFQGTPQEHAVVVGWSKHPNTIMKLSSLPETGQYPHREIAPVIKSLTDAYGPERLIYGGGFGAGATPESYRAYRERLRSYLEHLRAEDQEKVLGGNAARLFGFGAA